MKKECSNKSQHVRFSSVVVVVGTLAFAIIAPRPQVSEALAFRTMPHHRHDQLLHYAPHHQQEEQALLISRPKTSMIASSSETSTTITRRSEANNKPASKCPYTAFTNMIPGLRRKEEDERDSSRPATAMIASSSEISSTTTTGSATVADVASKCPFTAFTNMIGLTRKEDGSDNHKEATTSSSSSATSSSSTDKVEQRLLPFSSIPTSIGSDGSCITQPKLSPLESCCVVQLEQLYDNALTIKCPFFRRRAADILDVTDTIMRILMFQDSVKLELLGPPPSLRCKGKTCNKSFGLSKSELMEIIRQDWKSESNKGYYVTGRLSTNIYRDDCLFDGPDPDMPVRGLRKYLNAASQLFDFKTSTCQLLSLSIINDGQQDNRIQARWRFNGTLRLPWKPTLPEVTGTTFYRTDASGLIYRHEETWDNISATQAFFRTFLPRLSRRILPPKKKTPEEQDDY